MKNTQIKLTHVGSPNVDGIFKILDKIRQGGSTRYLVEDIDTKKVYVISPKDIVEIVDDFPW